MSHVGNEAEQRIADLEVRLTHQEASLDNLTAASVRQQRIVEEILAQLQQIKIVLRQMGDPAAGTSGDEPPPHY